MSFPRYPVYKDSGVEWLGEVPAHWAVVPLKTLVDIQNGADHKLVEAVDGYPVLGSGGLFAYATDYLYDGESVLLGRKGTIDKPLHVDGRFWTVDTMYWTKLRAGAHGRFVYYAALTIPFGMYATNTALPSMTKGVLNAHIMARPPVGEQAQIAAFLDRETARIDTLVAEQERLIELLAEKRQAVISHAVTKGLDPGVAMKDSGVEWLGEVPAHWQLPPLYTRYSQSLGKMLDTAKITGRSLMPYLRNLDVRWDAINSDNLPEMDIEPDERERWTVRQGDLLLVEGRELGRGAIWRGANGTVAFQKALHRLRPLRDAENVRFMYYTMAFANAVGVFFADQTPNEIPHLTGEELRRYRFPTPRLTSKTQSLLTSIERTPSSPA